MCDRVPPRWTARTAGILTIAAASWGMVGTADPGGTPSSPVPPAAGDTLAIGDTVAGTFDVAGKRDTFYIALTVIDTIDIAMWNNNPEGQPDVNPLLEVWAPDGSWVAEDNDYRDLSAMIPGLSVPTDGTYMIVARSAEDRTGSYLLKTRSSGLIVATEPGNFGWGPVMPEGSGPVTDSFWVQNAGTGTGIWTIHSTGEPWISVSQTSGAFDTPTPVVVTFDPSGLGQGDYGGHLSIEAVGDPWGRQADIWIGGWVHDARFSTVPGGPAGSTGGIEVHPDGDIVWAVDADLVRFDPATGVVTPWIASLSSTGYRSLNGMEFAADGSGALYVADRQDFVLRKVDPDGTVTVVLDAGEAVRDVATRSDGTVFAVSHTNIWRIDPDTTLSWEDRTTSVHQAAGGIFRAIEYSPLDGWVYFVEDTWLLRYDPESGTVESLADTHWPIWNLELGSDGDFYANQLRAPHVFRLSTSGEVLEEIWAPSDGKGLAITDGTLYQAPLSGELVSFAIPDGPVDPNASYLVVEGLDDFYVSLNGSAVDTVTIATNDGSATTVTLSESVPWLSVSPTNGVTPFDVELTVDATGLGEDRFSGALTLTSGDVANSPLVVHVDLDVAENLIALGGIAYGSIDTPDGRDRYAIGLEAGTVVDFALFSPAGSGLPPRLEFYDPDGNMIWENDCFRRCWNEDEVSAAILPGFEVPMSGLYRLEAMSSGSGSTGAYELKARLSGPIVATDPGHWNPIPAAEGQALPVTDTVWLYNVGRGTADWQVDPGEADWLTVSPMSGTLPAGSPASSALALERPAGDPASEPTREGPMDPASVRIFTDPQSAPEGSTPVFLTVDPSGKSQGGWYNDIRFFLPDDPWGGAELMDVQMRIHDSRLEFVTDEFGRSSGGMVLHPDGDLVMAGNGLIRADPDAVTHYQWIGDFGWWIGGLAVGSGGEIYVVNQDDHSLRRIDPDGSYTTVWSSENEMYDVAALPDGTLYITTRDNVWRRLPDGTMESLFQDGGVRGIVYNPLDGQVYFGNWNQIWRLDTSTNETHHFADTNSHIEDLDIGRSGRLYVRHWQDLTVVDASGAVAERIHLPSDGQGVVVTEGAVYLSHWTGLWRLPVDDGPVSLSEVYLTAQGPLRLTAGQDGTVSTTLNVSLSDGGSAGFRATWNASWLTVAPDTAGTPAGITVTADVSALPSGVHTDTIFLTSDAAANSPFAVPVHVTQASLAVGDVVAGEISFPWEVDIYSLSLQAGETIDLIVTDPDETFDFILDPGLMVYAPDGSEIAANHDYRGWWPLIPAMTAPETGVYRIEVDGWGEQTGPYVLKVRSSGPIVSTEPFSGWRIPAAEGGPATTETLWVFNAGMGSATWAVETSGEGWISVSPSGGSLPAATPEMIAAARARAKLVAPESEGQSEGWVEVASDDDAPVMIFTERAQAPEGSTPVEVRVDPAGFGQQEEIATISFNIDDTWGGHSVIDVYMRVYDPNLETLVTDLPPNTDGLAWHPSGRLLLATEGRLEWVDPQTGERTLWLDGGNPDARLNGITIAPDRSIYISDFDGGLYRVWPDGRVEEIFSPGMTVYGSTVLPDGTVYVGATDHLWRIDPDGTQTPVVNANNRIRAAGYNPHDGWVYYSDIPDLRRYNPGTGEVEVVADVAGPIYKIDVASSGNLYLDQCCGGPPNVRVMSPAGESIQEIWGPHMGYGSALGPNMLFVMAGNDLYRLPVNDLPLPPPVVAFAWPVGDTVFTGETVTVPLYLDMTDLGVAIGSFQASLSFNASLLAFQSLTGGDFQGTFDGNTNGAGQGTLVFAGINTNGSVNRDTTKFAEITFQVVGDWGAPGYLDLTVSEVTDVDFNDLSDKVVVYDGNVLVTPGSMSLAVRGEPTVSTEEAQPYALRAYLADLQARLGAVSGPVWFDPSVVVVDSVTLGDFGGTLEWNTDMQADSGFIRIAVVNPSPPDPDSVDLATVWMRAVGSGGDSTGVAFYPDEITDVDGFRNLEAFVTSNEWAWVRVAAGIWGDPTQDEKISALDALVCLSKVVGKVLPDHFDAAFCDVVPDNGFEFTGAVTAVDALAILSYVVGKTLPEHFRVGRNR